MKTCRLCGDLKPLDLFYKRPSNRDGYTTECRACIVKRARKSYHLNRNSSRAATRRHTRKVNGGWTDEMIRLKLIEQAYTCAICHVGIDQIENFHADHNHVTGEARGLLCHHCNHGLGRFRDNPDDLRSAIAYLTHYTTTRSTP